MEGSSKAHGTSGPATSGLTALRAACLLSRAAMHQGQWSGRSQMYTEYSYRKCYEMLFLVLRIYLNAV